MKNTKKLKVGIVVDDINQPYLVYDFYKKTDKQQAHTQSVIFTNK